MKDESALGYQKKVLIRVGVIKHKTASLTQYCFRGWIEIHILVLVHTSLSPKEMGWVKVENN